MPDKRPRRSHRRSSSKVSATSSSHSLSPSLSLSSLRRGVPRVHSLSSMAAAVSLREYSAEPGDAMVSLVGQAAAAVAEAVTQAKTVDAALMEVARHAVKALAATSALTDLAVNREKESRARAEGVASVDASRGQVRCVALCVSVSVAVCGCVWLCVCVWLCGCVCGCTRVSVSVTSGNVTPHIPLSHVMCCRCCRRLWKQRSWVWWPLSHCRTAWSASCAVYRSAAAGALFETVGDPSRRCDLGA